MRTRESRGRPQPRHQREALSSINSQSEQQSPTCRRDFVGGINTQSHFIFTPSLLHSPRISHIACYLVPRYSTYSPSLGVNLSLISSHLVNPRSDVSVHNLLFPSTAVSSRQSRASAKQEAVAKKTRAMSGPSRKMRKLSTESEDSDGPIDFPSLSPQTRKLPDPAASSGGRKKTEYVVSPFPLAQIGFIGV